uniref:DUF3741 domain-containing protein n=1 Tax=Arundo donax TaxID=35708 RepID=A0A0A9D627_ARUDO
MAKVPDLGTDFAQKLLKDLRRRRERLGFESAAAAQRGTGNAAPRDACSNSQKPLQAQKPRQAAPRVGRSAAATNRLHRQGNNSIAGPAKPRHHDAPPVAHSHAIVPFQEGGGGGKPKPAANVDVDVQMALALALSNRGKLQNIQLVASNGQNYLLPPNAHVGKVAIGVQKLNDILMAYSASAGAREFGRRGSVEMGKQLLRGAMDLEESLSMLMMLQEASDYMESSGNGKVLLLEGNQSRRSSSRSPSSARLVEIVEDSEAEEGNNAKSSSDASMQIVPHRMSQSSSPNHSSALQLITVTNSSKSHASSGDKDDSKVRMPNLIAKLMGLENLPSAKAAVERKGAERFVKPKAVPRKATATNAMVGTLPIRIVASERVPSKGQIKNLLARQWNISLNNSEESATATVLSNRPSHPITDRQTWQNMGQVLSKQESADRRVSLSQVVDEKIVHQNMKLTKESKLQKPVRVGCRNDVGKKMGFLQRFRKNANNKTTAEERDVIQENNRTLGKKQTASMKLLLGRDIEMKSRRQREKFNKKNLGSSEVEAAGKNGKTDQMRRQAQSKQKDKRIMAKKAQNHRQTQSETASQNLEHKSSLKSESAHTKQKLEYTALIQRNNGRQDKLDGIWSSKPSDNTPNDGGVFEQCTGDIKDSTAEGASSDQSERQTTEEINDPSSAVALTSEDPKVLDQGAIAETNADRNNHEASENTQILETFSKGEQKQQPQQMKEVKDQPRDGLDHTTESGSPTDLRIQKMQVVSCDSFTENQILLTEMLLKDHYLLETAKAITGIHVPVSTANVNTGKWLEKKQSGSFRHRAGSDPKKM